MQTVRYYTAISIIFLVCLSNSPSVAFQVNLSTRFDEIRVDNVDQLEIVDRAETTLVQDLVWFRDQQFIVSGDFGLQIFDVTQPTEPTETLSTAQENMLTIAIHNDMLAQAYDDVILWDLTTFEQITNYILPDNIMNVAFSRDGKWLAAGARQNNIYLWTVDENQQIILAHGLSLLSLSFDPNSETLIAVGDDSGRVERWQVGSGAVTKLSDFEVDSTSLSYATFSSDGNVIAIAAVDQKTYLLNSLTGEVLQTFSTAGELVTQLSFHPSHPLLAVTGGYEGLVQIWNVETGELVAKLEQGDGFIGRAIFNSEGTLLATVLVEDANSSEIAIWGIPIEE